MTMLQNVRVLLLGSGSSDTELLPIWLSSEGAFVKASSWQGALADMQQLSLNVVVLDMRADEAAAEAAVAQLRGSEVGRQAPIVALVTQAHADRAPVTRNFAATLVAPLHPSTLIQALVELELTPSAAPASAEDALASLIESRARTSDIRSIVKLLNATAPFRFTSILRFEDSGHLVSLWTFDRENPELNSFPEDATVSSSYCRRVRDSGQPFSMPDAAADPSVADHPARHSVLSYCGVPLKRADGSFFGTLCSYDVAPRFFQKRSLQRLLDASGLLERHWPELATR